MLIPEVPKLYPLIDVAVALNLSHEYVRRLARQGKIPARKIRNKFFMDADQVKAVALGERQ